MRAVVQRVEQSDVTVDGTITGAIKQGLMVLLGVGEEDTEKDVEYIADKVVGLRIFEDEDEKMNLSLLDVGRELLAVSQFTLYGDARKRKRPSFSKAAKPDIANQLYRKFVEKVQEEGIHVEEGIFQTHMLVKISHDEPVTILLDSKKEF